MGGKKKKDLQAFAWKDFEDILLNGIKACDGMKTNMQNQIPQAWKSMDKSLQGAWWLHWAHMEREWSGEGSGGLLPLVMSISVLFKFFTFRLY